MANSTIRAMTFATLAVSLAAGPHAQEADMEGEGSALPPTMVSSQLDAQRLETVQGVTLQWISWEERGEVEIARSDEGHWWLRGGQKGDDGASLKLDGFILEIGKDHFLFDGRITIAGAPDADRLCDNHKVWRFEATQRRAYYRLREFEWCDYLTDYVDIYFAPGLR
jgi:hypothetical protein